MLLLKMLYKISWLATLLANLSTYLMTTTIMKLNA